MIALRYIQHTDVPAIWGRIQEYLNSGLVFTHNTGSLPYLEAELRTGALGLWIAYEDETANIKGALVVEFKDYPTVPLKREMDIVLMGASIPMDRWLHLIEDVEKWAGALGATAVTVTGRCAWQKVLKPAGYEIDHIVLRKEVSHGC